MSELITECRGCGSKFLELVLDLGEIYPSDFVKFQEDSNKEPLQLLRCINCQLVQLAHTVELDTMYKQKYWYRSALNKSMLKDLKDVVVNAEKFVDLEDGDYVLDIGCNDGSLFDFYTNKNLIKIGFDPAPNLKELAESHCDYFINDYFTLVPLQWLPIENKVKVITSIAMFYDLPNPNKFIEDVSKYLSPDGLWVIQLTDLYSMFKVNAFDNICHEHLEYYSLRVLSDLLDRNELVIEDCEYNKVNGGSLRVYVRKQDYFGYGMGVSDRFIQALNDEEEYFFDHDFEYFNEQISLLKEKTLQFLADCKQNNKSVYLLGASTKGNTLLQIFNITKDLIPIAGEVNTDKFGLRTIGSDIPIISQEDVLNLKPDYLFVPIWHFINSILEKDWAKIYIENGGSFVVPLPEFKIYGKQKSILDIGTKTVGALIDELITTDMKCWYAQENLMNEKLGQEERLDAANKAQKMNARRNQLIRKIDEALGNGDITQLEKTYA
jgi:hypothetical protein